MSILIKGLEMPKDGSWINICIYPDGSCDKPNWQGDCTLLQGVRAVPIPPDVDLIDMDKLTEIEFHGLQADKTISYQMGWNDAIATVAKFAIVGEGKDE